MIDRAVGVREAALGKEVFKAPTGSVGKKLAENLRAGVRETRGKTLVMAGKEPPPKKVAEAHIKEQITNTTREKTAQKVLTDLYNFVDTGKINASAQKAMLRAMMLDPGYRQLLQQMNGKIVIELPNIMAAKDLSTNAEFKSVEKAINEYLRDPAYSQKLREQLADSLDLARPVNTELAAAQAARDHAQEQLDALNADLDATKAGSVAERLEKAKIDVEKFKVEYDSSGKVIAATMGDWAKRVNDLGNDIAAKSAALGPLKMRLENYERRRALSALKTSDPDWKDYQAVMAQVASMDAEVTKLSSEKKGLEELKTMREAEADKLQKEVDAKNAAKKEQAAKKVAADLAVAMAEKASESSDVAYIAQLESTYDKAVKAMLPDVVQEADAQYDAVLVAQQAIEKDVDMRALNDALIGDKFFSDKKVRTGIFSTEKQRALDKDLINKQYRNLLDNGPGGLVGELLRGQIEADVRAKYNVPFGPLEADQMAEVNNRLKAVADERGSEVAVRVMSLQLRLGGNISLQDAQRIQQSAWGPGMITAAMERMESEVEEIRMLKEKGGIDNLSQMSPEAFGGLLAFIMLLLGKGQKPLNPEGY